MNKNTIVNKYTITNLIEKNIEAINMTFPKVYSPNGF